MTLSAICATRTSANQQSPFQDVRFQSKKRANDIFFLILFILLSPFAWFVALSGIALSGYVSGHWLRAGVGNGSQVGSSVTGDPQSITFVLSIILNVFRIPLASLPLHVVMDVSKYHKSIYVVAFIALILQAALSVYTKWTPDNPGCGNGTSCSESTVAGLVFYVIPLDISSHRLILLRALRTRPYGSVLFYAPSAFGSLIVTIIEVVRFILSAARNNANAQESFVEACLACCAEFFVACIEGLVRYFDRYAYIEIALYGKPYIKAAKDTWAMFMDRGIDALVNDSLIGMSESPVGDTNIF
ncbi:plasma-membrane choline transporter-domain-containing protein [Suillus placidus]|uniref:Protein PNS1 n=1 Tax=Suillus placidus TaxID=48579 RepID=A0A9P7D3C0_9AGAM|nr:plasma-membrane choline transporter-domain-containing protein [Suillus placidus]